MMTNISLTRKPETITANHIAGHTTVFLHEGTSILALTFPPETWTLMVEAASNAVLTATKDKMHE
jgi:hypothetical protein